MNTTEHENSLTIDEAIRISKIICSVSEERIPIIVSVLEKAGININGLEELEEWKALKDQAYIIDMDEFVSELTRDSSPEDTEVLLEPKEFEEVCKQFNVKPSCAKRALRRKGLIKFSLERNEKINYTIPVWKDGSTKRYVVILKPCKEKEALEDG